MQQRVSTVSGIAIVMPTRAGKLGPHPINYSELFRELNIQTAVTDFSKVSKRPLESIHFFAFLRIVVARGAWVL